MPDLTVRCFPCVRAWQAPEATVYVAVIGFIKPFEADSSAPQADVLHATEDAAFEELASRTRRIGDLVSNYVVVVGETSYRDAVQAAQSVLEHRPRCS